MGQVLCGWCGHPIHSLSHYYHEQKKETMAKNPFFLFFSAVSIWLRYVIIETLYHKLKTKLTGHFTQYWPVYIFEGLFTLAWINLGFLGIIMEVF